MFIRIDSTGDSVHISEIKRIVVNDGERLVLHCPNYGMLEVAKELVASQSARLKDYDDQSVEIMGLFKTGI